MPSSSSTSTFNPLGFLHWTSGGHKKPRKKHRSNEGPVNSVEARCLDFEDNATQRPGMHDVVGEFHKHVKQLTDEVHQYWNNWQASEGREQELSNQFKAFRESHEIELRGKDGHYTQRLRDLDCKHSAAVKQLQEEHEKSKGKQRQQISRLKEELQGAHQERENTLVEHSNELELQRVAHREEKQLQKVAHQEEKQELINDHQVTLESVIATQNRREDDLVADHKRATHHLRHQVDELNTALIARDDEMYSAKVFITSGLPQRSDGKLAESFAEIEKAVEDLGRIEWSPGQDVYTERDLQRLSSSLGLRVVKKGIVQDILWCSLFNFVFASPFRMFGAEGIKLEREWAENANQDLTPGREPYEWPVASAQAERWRYMTLDSCRQILTQKLSQLDPRAPFKKGYTENTSELIRSLKTIISDIAPLTSQTSEAIERLSKRSAKIWLDFGMHRCRIVVGLAGSGTSNVSERIAEIRSGSVTLTLSPVVGRYGNHRGADLDIFTTLSGCGGDTLEIR